MTLSSYAPWSMFISSPHSPLPSAMPGNVGLTECFCRFYLFLSLITSQRGISTVALLMMQLRYGMSYQMIFDLPHLLTDSDQNPIYYLFTKAYQP